MSILSDPAGIPVSSTSGQHGCDSLLNSVAETAHWGEDDWDNMEVVIDKGDPTRVGLAQDSSNPSHHVTCACRARSSAARASTSRPTGSTRPWPGRSPRRCSRSPTSSQVAASSADIIQGFSDSAFTPFIHPDMVPTIKKQKKVFVGQVARQV